MEKTIMFGEKKISFWACNDSESYATIRAATIAARKKENNLIRLEPYEIKKIEMQKKTAFCVVLEHRHFVYVK